MAAVEPDGELNPDVGYGYGQIFRQRSPGHSDRGRRRAPVSPVMVKGGDGTTSGAIVDPRGRWVAWDNNTPRPPPTPSPSLEVRARATGELLATHPIPSGVLASTPPSGAFLAATSSAARAS